MANNKKKLIIEIEVEDKIEAYKIVSETAFSYSIVSASLDGEVEKFDKENTPFHFLKDNKKNKKSFRDIRAERLK